MRQYLCTIIFPTDRVSFIVHKPCSSWVQLLWLRRHRKEMFICPQQVSFQRAFNFTCFPILRFYRQVSPLICLLSTSCVVLYCHSGEVRVVCGRTCQWESLSWHHRKYFRRPGDCHFPGKLEQAYLRGGAPALKRVSLLVVLWVAGWQCLLLCGLSSLPSDAPLSYWFGSGVRHFEGLMCFQWVCLSKSSQSLGGEFGAPRVFGELGIAPLIPCAAQKSLSELGRNVWFLCWK